jgi:hypothetical protein
MINRPSSALRLDRRAFLRTGSLGLGLLGLAPRFVEAWGTSPRSPKDLRPGPAVELPAGSAPPPVPLPHFPDRLHAFVWRNWQLVPAERMAGVLGATRAQVVRLGRRMGLAGPTRISAAQQRRSALSVIRRNWHLLPYAQLLELLGWTPEQMAFTLREDDFLFVKLGSLKPRCEPLRYRAPDARTLEQERALAHLVRSEFPQGAGRTDEPLFAFVDQLSRPPTRGLPWAGGASAFSPRFCYSYFALYGDPLLEPALDPYPDGYLARLAASGVDGVWLQAVLTRLAPFPWDIALSRQYEVRLQNLRKLVHRARRHGLGVFLYLNEPRALPLGFFATRPELKGVAEGDYAALCTSIAAVRDYLESAVAAICRAVPDLAGFFTISGSENLTHCWSHGGGAGCLRCGQRKPSEVIAELHAAFQAGIRQGGGRQQLIAWDWGWNDAWVEDIIARLPAEVKFMSVSEWATPIHRGGVATEVGEYSISTVGPGPRAQRHWSLARRRGLKTLAKIQAGNTWELSAVPYIPALVNVARHAAHLAAAGVDGLMLGWTLGGYPSPNLEVVARVGAAHATGSPIAPEAVLAQVAEERYGQAIAPAVLRAWTEFSEAFCEFPFHGALVYSAPLQLGPANLLWGEPTGYRATMVGFPYDDLDAWRAVYPPEVFVNQLEKVAGGFERAHAGLAAASVSCRRRLTAGGRAALEQELNVGEAAAIHFRSTANQARFVLARHRLTEARSSAEFGSARDELERSLRSEITVARRLHAIQSRDSRIGFEASNQYYYVPVDLAEKVINCQDLLTRWLPAQKWSASEP